MTILPSHGIDNGIPGGRWGSIDSTCRGQCRGLERSMVAGASEPYPLLMPMEMASVT